MIAAVPRRAVNGTNVDPTLRAPTRLGSQQFRKQFQGLFLPIDDRIGWIRNACAISLVVRSPWIASVATLALSAAR